MSLARARIQLTKGGCLLLITASQRRFGFELTVEIRRGFRKTPALESRQNKIVSGRIQAIFSDKNRMHRSATVPVWGGGYRQVVSLPRSTSH
jgi:hypothetical protein